MSEAKRFEPFLRKEVKVESSSGHFHKGKVVELTGSHLHIKRQDGADVWVLFSMVESIREVSQ